MTTKSLSLLLNKNLKVERRSYPLILLEIITILAIFVTLLRINTRETIKETQIHSDIKLDDLSEFRKLMFINETTIPYKLYFTPKNDYTENIFKKTVGKLNLLESVGFDSEESMVEQFKASAVLAGVILQDHHVTLRFPNYFRTRQNKNYYELPEFWLTRCAGFSEENNVDFYIREGFLPLLYTIVRTQIEEEKITITGEIPTQITSIFDGNKPNVGCVNEMSRKSFSRESFLKWSLYYFIFFVPFINLIWKLSREHEENIFAHHWIYGFSYNYQRLAHLIMSLVHFILLDIIVITLLSFLWPALAAGKIVLCQFLVVYNMLLILYAMLISSIIKNAKTALWSAITLWIFSYAVFLEVLYANNFDILKPKFLIISSLFFNNLFSNGLMDYFEEGKPLTKLLLFLGVECLIMLFYGFLIKFVDNKWPGRYIKMFRNTRNKQTCTKLCMELKPKLDESYIEYGPVSGGVLQLKHVYSYCNHFERKIQLKDISMRFVKNEISVILGPHNSGKTSFISILAGWEAYKGRIVYQGHDISEGWAYYRQHVDVSMPNNSLFDFLTIQETLNYFILIKQTDETHLKNEVEKWINVLSPIADGQKLVKTLSFSEKRVLALCCTMVCNTAVILLDEPTAHMRSEEQNIYWSILKQEKQNRVIIVTTFNVDEANEIGDRIGILNDGCLSAWGTSYFLRTKLCPEIYLVCFLQPKKPIGPITIILEKYIQNFKINYNLSDRVIYIIPADKKPFFQRLLIELEKDFSALGITNIYMAGSSLNEVYMALTPKRNVKTHPTSFKNILKVVYERKTKFNKNSVHALFYKKLLRQAKNCLPICLIFLSFCLILAFNQTSPSYLNVKSITISGHDQEVPKDPGSLIEIIDVDNIENGLFHYKLKKNSDNSIASNLIRGHNSMAALEVTEPSTTVWFNEKIFHSAPLALNLAFNYFTNGSTYTNKPIIVQSKYDIHIILGTIMPLTMSAVFLQIQDLRVSNMLTLQRIGHVSDKTRWTMSFLWHYSIFILISILYLTILILCVIAKPTWLIVMAALMLFFLCGMASLFFIYLISLFVMEDNYSRAFIKIFLILFSLGLLPYVIFTTILENKPEMLFYVLMLLPGFSVLHGTTKIFDNNEKLELSSYFQWNDPGIVDSLVFMFITCVIYFTIFVAVLVYRRAYFKSTPEKVKGFASVCYPYDDDRVVKEKVRISNMNIDSCRAQIVLVDQLESILPKKGNRINTISFNINKHCCLGIYGSSHSGKSHILKQLVGEEGYWFGEVYIAGFNCKKQMYSALKHIGYCPQNTGCNSLLTPSELLTFFLKLYGVKESKLLDHIRHLSMALHLHNHMNSAMGNLPENIKRRVNVAVALIARKRILILDEPTRGLPAFDRLLIWNILKFCRSLNNTVIFTTSESLELKELADIVVTVNDGEMLCYDNPYNLEYLYNVGFYLEIKLYADGLTLEEVEENLNTDLENLNRFVKIFHEETELLYHCDNVVKYYIPVENVEYSYIFGIIEKSRNRLNIADYNLAASSLNKVLKLLQKYRKEKRRYERSGVNVLRDPKTLPRRN